jgi:putative ABC transport system substrate-binding protein
MNPKILWLLTAILLVPIHPSDAQQPTKVPRIGFLSVNSLADNAARIEAFRYGLRELGYVEGRNIVIEWRSAEGKFDRLLALATDLVNLKVDVIVSYGPTPTRVAKKATATIPIVMGFDGDPVGSGMVASLARPGGNITGLSSLAPELSGKQLELLKEIVPKLSRVAVLGNSDEPGNAHALKEMELAAGAFNIQLQYQDVLNLKDIESSFQAASEQRAGAVIVLAGPVMSPHRTEVVKLAAKNRLPAR